MRFESRREAVIHGGGGGAPGGVDSSRCQLYVQTALASLSSILVIMHRQVFKLHAYGLLIIPVSLTYSQSIMETPNPDYVHKLRGLLHQDLLRKYDVVCDW